MAGELLLSTLRHVWATLAALKIDVALMGGIAVAAWHYLRNTRDVDLLVGMAPADLESTLQELSNAGIKPLHEPPLMRLGQSSIVQLSFQPPGRFMDVRIDLFIAETEYHRCALSRRISLSLPGMDAPVYILSCEDLILFKLLAGRLIDRSDCAHLLRANRDTINLTYLREWTLKLQLDNELREVWREAFGADTPPPVQ